ncbi:hypothetical protein [Flavobacterium sp.]|uniref:hypothetical protein n=1 Tax=Flavobacterium sp. TaxID=239 RepID=UPI0040477C3A
MASKKTKKSNIITSEIFSESQLNFSVAKKKHKIAKAQSKKYNPKNCDVLFCLPFPLNKKRNANTNAVNMGSSKDIKLGYV